MFPGCLDKLDGPLPEELLPKAAMEMIETQFKDSVLSLQLGTNLFQDVLDRGYTPSQNGPREYFKEADDDVRISLLIGSQPIPITMAMEAAQQAFMNSGHPKDEIRDLNEEWGRTVGTHPNEAVAYQQF